MDVLSESLGNYLEVATGGAFKKKIQRRCFPVNIAKFLRTPILKNISE